MDFSRSKEMQTRIHRLIPGGCHTYAKGDDQYPELSPGLIARGHGAHVWDVDGNAYIEYGLGGRAVTGRNEVALCHDRRVRRAMPTYQRALEDGAERFLVGPPSNIVYRRYN